MRPNGKTFRACCEALKLLSAGNNVVIVTSSPCSRQHTMGMIREMIVVIKDIVEIKENGIYLKILGTEKYVFLRCITGEQYQKKDHLLGLKFSTIDDWDTM